MATYYKPETISFLNGEWVKASETKTDLYSQTLHYGCGCFEGIRSYDTESGVNIFRGKEHYERLISSAQKMYLELKYSAQKLVDITHRLLEKNGFKDAYIRPLVFVGADMSLRASTEVNLLICTWEWGPYLGDRLLNIMTSSYQRPNPKSCHVESKITGHYTNSILATTEAKQSGYDEALLLDMNGYVAEGPGANFFYEKDNVLYTCPRGNILPGITRAVVFELASQLGIEVKEEFFKDKEVEGSDSAFFTGTAAEIAGISSLNGVPFKKDWESSLGNQLSIAYKNLVLSNVRHYSTVGE